MDDAQHRKHVIGDIFTAEWRNPRSRYEQMLLMEGPEMTWTVENSGAEGQTISKDALVMLRDHFATWVGSRLMLAMMNADPRKNPKKPRITVKVTVDFDE